MSSRFGATIEQLKNDITTGIEGNDIVDDSLRVIRNGAIATWHAIQGVIPSIAGAVSGQDYQVVQRTSGFQGTTNAVKKVVQTKGIVGKASAVFAELTDGPVDDLLALTGGAQHIIVPTRSSLSSTFRG